MYLYLELEAKPRSPARRGADDLPELRRPTISTTSASPVHCTTRRRLQVLELSLNFGRHRRLGVTVFQVKPTFTAVRLVLGSVHPRRCSGGRGREAPPYRNLGRILLPLPMAFSTLGTASAPLPSATPPRTPHSLPVQRSTMTFAPLLATASHIPLPLPLHQA